MSKEKHNKKKDEKSKSRKDKKHGTKKEEKHGTKKEEKHGTKKEEKPKLNKDEKSDTEIEYEFGKGKVERFDKLVKENRDSGRNWYHGLEGKWWWGMEEDDVRTRLIEVEQILGQIKYTDEAKENKTEVITNPTNEVITNAVK